MSVSAIDTVVATVPVGLSLMRSPSPRTGNTSMSRMNSPMMFSVIAMATNTVVATVAVKQTGTLRYAFHAEAKSADLAGTKNPVQVSLTII
jgi:hypothetical protein